MPEYLRVPYRSVQDQIPLYIPFIFPNSTFVHVSNCPRKVPYFVSISALWFESSRYPLEFYRGKLVN